MKFNIHQINLIFFKYLTRLKKKLLRPKIGGKWRERDESCHKRKWRQSFRYEDICVKCRKNSLVSPTWDLMMSTAPFFFLMTHFCVYFRVRSPDRHAEPAPVYSSGESRDHFTRSIPCNECHFFVSFFLFQNWNFAGGQWTRLWTPLWACLLLLLLWWLRPLCVPETFRFSLLSTFLFVYFFIENHFVTPSMCCHLSSEFFFVGATCGKKNFVFEKSWKNAPRMNENRVLASVPHRPQRHLATKKKSVEELSLFDKTGGWIKSATDVNAICGPSQSPAPPSDRWVNTFLFLLKFFWKFKTKKPRKGAE